eukprot:gene2700-25472_t
MGRSDGVRAGRKAGIGTDVGAGSHATLTLVGGGAVLGVVVAAVSMLAYDNSAPLSAAPSTATTTVVNGETVVRLSVPAELEAAALAELLTNPTSIADAEAEERFSSVWGSEEAVVRQSKIPKSGRGAFATRDYKPGEVVAIYWCRMLPSKEIRDWMRTWDVNKTHLCDGTWNPLHNP